MNKMIGGSSRTQKKKCHLDISPGNFQCLDLSDLLESLLCSAQTLIHLASTFKGKRHLCFNVFKPYARPALIDPAL